MHAIITGCSCVVSMDLTVGHKQNEETWRQQIIVVAEYEFSSIVNYKNARSKIAQFANFFLILRAVNVIHP